MDFMDWVNTYYGDGLKIDICDLSEDEVADLYEEFELAETEVFEEDN